MEPEEAFPNVDHIFQQAFAAQDPAPLLLQILKEHPTYIAIRDLVIHYTEAVENDPYNAKTLASALARIIHSPDAPSFGPPQNSDSLDDLLYSELGDTHFKVIHDKDAAIKYGPKNSHLLDSLLSGFALKYNLSSSSAMLAPIDDGLKAPRGSSESELLVVGTCIQLLIHGSGLTPELAGPNYHQRPEKVAKELKAHKAAETVKDHHAIEVLEVLCFLFIF